MEGLSINTVVELGALAVGALIMFVLGRLDRTINRIENKLDTHISDTKAHG